MKAINGASTEQTWESCVERVVIHTPSYLNFHGNYSAGGLQRHIRDLAAVIRDDWLRDVLIVQKGVRDFVKTCDCGFKVIGLKSNLEAKGDPVFAYKVKNLIQQGDGLLYAGGEDAWPFFVKGAKAIQHGVWWDGPQPGITRFIQKIRALSCMKAVRSMLCVDTNFINWLRAQGKVGLSLAVKCTYIPNYADLSLLEISVLNKVPPLRLICARRYEKKRGTDLFIDALGQLKKRGFYFVAHISTVGGLAEIKARLALNELGPEVSVSEDDMDTVLKRYGTVDVVVVPSIWSEGTSFACVEALCAGLPVVATPVGGLGNLIIPGFNGFLVSPSAASIAQAVEKFFDVDLLVAMRRNCLSMRDALKKDVWRVRVLEWIKE